jgi:tRNA A37 threonylcarbamoyladenosine modification protein TsaB
MKRSKITLAIDAAMFRGSISIWKDGVLSASFVGEDDASFSRDILPIIKGLLSECGAALPELEKIVYTYGPGSNTGLRVGISSVLGLRRTRGDLKIYPVSVFEAFSVLRTGNRCRTAILQSKNLVAQQIFSSWTARKDLRTELSTLFEFGKQLDVSDADLIIDRRLDAALNELTDGERHTATVVDASDNVSILAHRFYTRSEIPELLRMPLYLRT